MSYCVVHVWFSCPCTIYLCQYFLWVSIYSFCSVYEWEWDRIKTRTYENKTDRYTYIPDADSQPQHEYLHTIRHNISEYNPTPESTTRKGIHVSSGSCLTSLQRSDHPYKSQQLAKQKGMSHCRVWTWLQTDRLITAKRPAISNLCIQALPVQWASPNPNTWSLCNTFHLLYNTKYTNLGLLLKMRQDKSYTARMQLQTRLL